MDMKDAEASNGKVIARENYKRKSEQQPYESYERKAKKEREGVQQEMEKKACYQKISPRSTEANFRNDSASSRNQRLSGQ